MFNLKKYVLSADLSKKVSPAEIPGETIQEKAAYIAEYLDKEIGDKLSSGEISIDTAYKLLAETKVSGVPEQFSFLEKYRSNIANLVSAASGIKSELGSTGLSNEQISSIIISKLLSRVQEVFIPELIELNRTGKRTSDEATQVLSKLPTYQDQDKIMSIKAWISREIQREIQDVINEYKDIEKRALEIPDFDKDDLVIMLTHTPIEALKIIFPERKKTGTPIGPSKFTDPTIIKQVEYINEEIQKLSKKVSIKGETGWTKVLALSSKMSEEELSKWKDLVQHPIEFNLYKILKNAGLVSAGMNASMTENPVKLKNNGFRDTELRSRYQAIFFPDIDPSTNKPFLSDSEQRYLLEKFGHTDPRRIEYGVDQRTDFIKRSQSRLKSKYAKDRLYEFIQEGYDGPGLMQVIMSNNLPLDQAGLAIRYYYKSVCKGDRNKFLGDLKEIGLEEHYSTLSQLGNPVDKNYEDLRLTTDSTSEAEIIRILREEFGIDAVPFKVLVPIPVDCPTNANNFDVDFMMHVDVLDYIDPETFMPVVKPKIMFVAEYYGFKSDSTREIVDRGKPWVDPDGNVYTTPSRLNKRTGEMMTFQPILPGNTVTEGEVYNLKTLWKKRTYDTIAHLFGTDALGFDVKDTKAPYITIARKLDEKDIIYTFSGCGSEPDICKAKKMIDASLDFERKAQLGDINYQKGQVNNEKQKCLRVVDTALFSYKLQNVLKQVRQEFVGKSGFDRKTLAAHHYYVLSIREEIQKSLKILSSINASSATKKAAQERIEVNLKDLSSLENSPLLPFKQRLEEVMQENKHASIIAQFEDLKDAIQTGKISPTLLELRNYLLEIDEGVFGFVPDPENV
jgi:hypothetical protein